MAEMFAFPTKLKALMREYTAEDIGRCLGALESERQASIFKTLDICLQEQAAALRMRNRVAEALILEGMAVYFAGILTDLARLSAIREGRPL